MFQTALAVVLLVVSGCAPAMVDVRRSETVPLKYGKSLEFISPRTPDLQGNVTSGLITVLNDDDARTSTILQGVSTLTTAKGIIDQLLDMAKGVGQNAALGLGFDFPANRTTVSQTGFGSSGSYAGGGTGVGLGGQGGNANSGAYASGGIGLGGNASSGSYASGGNANALGLGGQGTAYSGSSAGASSGSYSGAYQSQSQLQVQ